MARFLHVYPKAGIIGSEWWFHVKVFDQTTRVSSKFKHTIAAGVTAEIPLVLLKVGWDMTTDDSATDSDVDDALFVDDIKPGAGAETVWSNWQEIAESIISGLLPGYSYADFKAAWSTNDTSSVRADARRALVTQRGWVIETASIHQHEGDGSVTEQAP
jgi:hypothetical protein